MNRERFEKAKKIGIAKRFLNPNPSKFNILAETHIANDDIKFGLITGDISDKEFCNYIVK